MSKAENSKKEKLKALKKAEKKMNCPMKGADL